jgi:hypothetical protein
MTAPSSTMKLPSALAPVVMSLLALALVLGHIALFGVARQPDEGAAAHTWQFLMSAQVPLVAYFAVRYLPQRPKPAARVLALQVLAGLAACAPVFLLHL